MIGDPLMNATNATATKAETDVEHSPGPGPADETKPANGRSGLVVALIFFAALVLLILLNA
jgi:hypothetical protein